MFWTDFVRKICTAFIILAIIASVIGGIICFEESILLGLGIMVGGVFVSLLSISGVMVICEISDNVYEIRLNSRSSSNHSSLIKSYSNAPDSFVPESTQGSWKCPKCGKSNSNSSRVCKDCGYQK